MIDVVEPVVGIVANAAGGLQADGDLRLAFQAVGDGVGEGLGSTGSRGLGGNLDTVDAHGANFVHQDIKILVGGQVLGRPLGLSASIMPQIRKSEMAGVV